MIDKGSSNFSIFVKGKNNLIDSLTEKAVWTIRKFASKEDYIKGNFYEESIIKGNILLNEGINTIWTLVAGGSATSFNSSNSYLGVGDSTTSESPTQTGLQATTNKLYKAVDSGYPTYGTNQKITFRATFNGSEANFAWNEFTVANGNSDSAVNLNRKVSSQGTKVSGQIWELTLEIELS
jgi:hypothetical protein